jgi:hypothetical protein
LLALLALLPLLTLLALLPLLALLTLAGLPLTLLARVCEVASRVLESGCRSGEIAIDIHIAVSTFEGFGEALECLPSGVVLTLSQALGGVTQRRSCCTARLTCCRLEF